MPPSSGCSGLSYPVAKRCLDVVVAGGCFALLLPLLLVVSLLIVLDSPGSPLFVQERVGLRGRRIRVLKLRTMTVDAEAHLARLKQQAGLQDAERPTRYPRRAVAPPSQSGRGAAVDQRAARRHEHGRPPTAAA